jgi:hypothetical protein
MDLKDEVADCAKKVCTVFTKEYIKAYALAMVRIIKKQVNAAPEPDWQLTKRPKWDEDYKSGYLTKEGGNRKNWKKRWFLVKPSYNVEYYETEAAVAKGPKAKKGLINLCGYWVNTDPNDSVLGRLKRLAERMGVNFDNLPKPKEYPPLTLELHHNRRRCYFITAATKEEFDDWVAQFRICCWHARGFTMEDPAHWEAFPVAVRKTRWELGRWGWYSNYGTEEQVLAELISDELDYDVMSRAYYKLSGPWMIRNMLRNKMEKLFDSIVIAAVKPAWAGMAAAVEKTKPIIEPKINEAVRPIFEAEKGIIEKMKEKVMSTITPIQEEKVNPHLVKIVDIVRKPMRDAFAEAYILLDDKLTKYEPKDGTPLNKSFSDLDWFPRSYWQMRDATNKSEEMIEGLRDLQVIFTDIWPWSLCYHGQTSLREVTDNAVYTFEQELIKQAGESKPSRDMIDRLRKEILEKFKHDSDIAVKIFSAKVMKLIVMPPFEALLNPAAKLIIQPLADLIPGPLQEFIDINQDFEDLYNGIIDDAIDSVVNHPSAD